MKTRPLQTRVCSECASPLTGGFAEGPCPACLMRLGLNSWQKQQSLQSYQLEPTDPPNGSPLTGMSTEWLASKFPQYELLHMLGAGGMGVVYCARQKSLDRLVALKVIKPEANNRTEFADRFAREAKAMAQLNHPNIVTVHDFGELDGVYYFVMEFMDGVNLRQMLRSNKLTAKQALEIVPAICDALQYAHDRGIVHRDIKPENILIDVNGTVKIADFGLAKLLDQDAPVTQLTQANHVMGTMHYMAPEQIETPLTVDHRADIYSLGVVIYELLTGELPLGRFAPPSQKVSIDVRLDEIVLQTLAKEPALRYQRVSDVKSELTTVASEYGSSPIPPFPKAGDVPVKPEPLPMPSRPFPGPIPECSYFGALVSPQSWKNVAYLITALPVGIFMFVMTLVGLSVGLGTIIVWVGIPILLLTLLGVRSMMQIERFLMANLLETWIPQSPRSALTRRGPSLGERVKDLAFNPRSAKGVFFLLSKLVTGVLSFSLCITLLAIPLSMVTFWLQPGWVSGGELVWHQGDWLGAAIQQNRGIVAIAGLLLMPASLWVCNGMAKLNADWARLWLADRSSAPAENLHRA